MNERSVAGSVRVLLSGYYGFGNTGDEAVLAGVITALRRAGSVEMTVLSARPSLTEHTHGVKALPRTHVPEIWRALRQSDLFISGGGSLLQDVTSRRSPYYYLGLLRMARWAGVPAYVFGQGMGPIQSAFTRRYVGRVLARAAGIGVRDMTSAEWLADLGVPPSLIVHTADAAFALSSLSEPDVNPAPGKGRRRIGVIWRSCEPMVDDAGQKRLTGAVAGALLQFARNVDSEVVIVPFQPEVDRPACEGLQKAMVNRDAKVAVTISPGGGNGMVTSEDDALDYSRFFDMVASMDIVLAVRFHGLVFAVLKGVPAVTIQYDPKVSALSRQLGVRRLDPRHVTAHAVYEALMNSWTHRDSMKTRFHSERVRMARRVFEEGERALRCAKGRG